jgi:hypothetical protein
MKEINHYEQGNKAILGSSHPAKTNSQIALISGMLAGVAGLLTFLIIHALWITPIWFILPLGLMVALLGGSAVGWAYAEVRHKLPPRPGTAAVVAVLIVAILLPATILAELRQPMFAITPAGAVFQMALGRAIFVFIAELPLTAAIVGGLLGWWLGRTRRAAGAMALAGVIFALGPGHNIPFIGGTGGLAKEWIIMGAVIVVAALVQTEAYARLNTTDPKLPL